MECGPLRADSSFSGVISMKKPSVSQRARKIRCLQRVLAPLLAVIAGAVPAFFMPVPAVSAAELPQVSAQSAVVLHMDSGEILYEKNAREQRAMASTTKIMTALLTLEAAALENPEVEITQEMVLVEGSSMGRQRCRQCRRHCRRGLRGEVRGSDEPAGRGAGAFGHPL